MSITDLVSPRRVRGGAVTRPAKAGNPATLPKTVAESIPLRTGIFSGGAPSANGRDIHAFLGARKDFTTWAKVQVQRARLVEGRDFVKLTQKGELSATGQIRAEYEFSPDAAKHIGMLSGTERGFEVREYFIGCERKALEASRSDRAEVNALLSAPPASYSDALRALADMHDGRQRTERALAAVESLAAAQQPAVVAQARLAGAGGELCLTDDAKSLQMRRIDLTAWLSSHEWIYRRDSREGRAGPWRATHEQVKAGRLAHRVVTYTGRDGSERMDDQVVITPKGLAKLAELLGASAS